MSFVFLNNLPLDYCRQDLEGIHDRIDPDQLQTFQPGRRALESDLTSSKISFKNEKM